MMSEEELLTLIREKSPEELSVEECETLRAGLRTSAALRRECAERLHLEQVLAHAIGRPRVSVEKIRAQAKAAQGWLGGMGGVKTRLGFLVGLALLGGLAIVMSGRGGNRGQPVVAPGAGEVAAVSEETQKQHAAETLGDDTAADDAEEMTAATSATAPASTAEPSPAATPVEAPSPAVEAPAPAAAVAGDSKPAVDDPWTANLRALADVPASPAAVFAGVMADSPPPTADVLKLWFEAVEAVPGKPDTVARFGVQPIARVPHGKFDGLVRLRAPLAPGTSLRLAVQDFSPLRIHAWSGTEGATLDAYGPTGPWAGYATSRTGTEPVPTRRVLAARDEGRMARTNSKPPAVVELRHVDGLLTLSRGDVRIVEVPLAEPPTEIYFEGSGVFREIAMTKAYPLPVNRWPPAAPKVEPLAIARQPWQMPAGFGGGFSDRADGGVELVAVENPQPVWATMQVPEGRPCELALRIDAHAPGTGILLADREGKPQRVLAFLVNKHDKSLVQLAVLNPGDNRLDAEGKPQDAPLPFVDGSTWLRLGHCGGLLRCAVSADGVRWTQAFDPIAAGPLASIGLYAAANPAARRIALGEISLLPLAMLESLAPVDLRQAAVELPEVLAFPAWREAAIKAKPPAADEDAWLRACAIRRLASACPKELAIELLSLLWHDSLQVPLAFEDRLRLLDEIAAIAPVWADPPAATRIAKMYDELGQNLADVGKPRAYSQVAHAQQTCPLLCSQPFPFFPESLARREVLELAIAGRSDDLAGLSARIAFFGFDDPPANAPFFNWASALSAKRPAASRDWRHPLVTEPGKEGVTLAADLSAALEGAEYRHACEMFLATDDVASLLPDRTDPDLLASLPVTVATLMADEPPLQETMRAEFGDRGTIRVRQAIDQGNARAAEATTFQYFGTEAAAEAHAWLGDRCLSGGDIATALDHYRLARSSAAAALAPRLSAAEEAAKSLGGSPRGVAATSMPAARDYEPTARARLEGDVGGNPAGVPAEYGRGGPGFAPQSIDWVARQVAFLPLADRLLVSNRFQIASYDPQSGSLQWRAGVGGDAAATHEWAGQPMRPVVNATHAFVRRLKKAGPVLASINLADAKEEWETLPRPERFLVSDPVLIDGVLHGCTATKVGDEYLIALAAYDTASGELVRERPLVSLRESWWRQRDCQISPIDGSLAITCGGSVVCCDLTGAVRWVRKNLWVPVAVDSFWMVQAQSPPLVVDGRLFVAQPGVPAVVALDAASGRVLWKASLPEARRVLGVVRAGEGAASKATQSLIVERSTGLVALDVATGDFRWRFESRDLLDACLVHASDGVLVTVREQVPNEKAFLPVLMWLDPNSGQPRHRTPLAALKDPDPRLGPLVRQGDRVWALFGRGPADAARDLVELVPK
jgi:outer membrane protein assembly factor BamB